jgi:hypothetical protein
MTAPHKDHDSPSIPTQEPASTWVGPLERPLGAASLRPKNQHLMPNSCSEGPGGLRSPDAPLS